MKFLLKSFFIILLSLQVYAEQGFNTDMTQLPEAIKPWSKRTFMVVSFINDTHFMPVGTAFYFQSDSNYSYFVSADHVTRLCLYKCVLIQNIEFETNPFNLASISSFQKYSPLISPPIIEVGIFTPEKGDWLPTEFAHDIGYFKTILMREMTTQFSHRPPEIKYGFQKLKLLNENQSHFIVGYPGLRQRQDLTGVTEPSVVKLRFSKGDKLKSRPERLDGGMLDRPTQQPNSKFIIYSNADSIGGNSGSPVISDDGQLIGILYGGPSNSEYYPELNFNSYLAPAIYLKYLTAEFKKSSSKALKKIVPANTSPTLSKTEI